MTQENLKKLLQHFKDTGQDTTDILSKYPQLVEAPKPVEVKKEKKKSGK